jgi:hypothetical protein
MTRLRRAAPLALAGLAVLAATLAVYARTLSADFVAWDDATTIYANPGLGDLSLDRIAWAFTDTASTMRWIPLTLLGLVVTHTVHGLDPFGYHLASWLLHGAAALAVLLILRELLGRAARAEGGRDAPWVLASAAAGALAWSLHPLRVEVVAWCNSRGHAQAGLLVMLSLLAYLRAHRDEAPEGRRRRGVAVSAGCFLAALLSHPVALGAAPLFPLLDVHLGRLGGAAGWRSPAARPVLLEKLPFAAAAALVLAVALLVRTLAPGRWPAPVPLSEWGLFPRAMQATWIWVHYVLVTLWPAGLQPAPTALIDFDPWTAPFLLRAAAVAAVTGALLALRRRWPLALLLWLAHLLSLAPALGLTEHPMFACDRYAYLPGLVPAAALAAGLWWLGRAPARRWAAGAAAAALLALLGGLSVAQAGVWRDSVTLFGHMLPLIGPHPYRTNILVFQGFAQRAAGNPAAAVEALAQVAPLRPDDPSLQQVLGESYIEAGRAAEGAPHLAVAVQADQINVDLRCRYMMTLVAAGRIDEARSQLRIAQGLAPAAPCVRRFMLRLQPAPR